MYGKDTLYWARKKREIKQDCGFDLRRALHSLVVWEIPYSKHSEYNLRILQANPEGLNININLKKCNVMFIGM